MASMGWRPEAPGSAEEDPRQLRREPTPSAQLPTKVLRFVGFTSTVINLQKYGCLRWSGAPAESRASSPTDEGGLVRFPDRRETSGRSPLGVQRHPRRAASTKGHGQDYPH